MIAALPPRALMNLAASSRVLGSGATPSARLTMLPGFATLILFQVLGEASVALLGLPVPGPVAGMALLLAGLSTRGGEAPEWLSGTTDGLLRHLSLLFVPAGTGIVALLAVLQTDGAAVLAALLVSLTLVVVAGGRAIGYLERVPGLRAELSPDAMRESAR